MKKPLKERIYVDLGEIPDLVRKISDECLLPLPEVEFSYRMRKTLGRCNKLLRRITLNAKFCEINSKEVVSDLIKHELAHLLEGGHDGGFADLCSDLDIPVHTHLKHPDMKLVGGKYRYICFDCGKITYTNRRFKRKRSCGSCSGGRYNERYLLIEMV